MKLVSSAETLNEINYYYHLIEIDLDSFSVGFDISFLTAGSNRPGVGCVAAIGLTSGVGCCSNSRLHHAAFRTDGLGRIRAD